MAILPFLKVIAVGLDHCGFATAEKSLKIKLFYAMANLK